MTVKHKFAEVFIVIGRIGAFGSNSTQLTLASIKPESWGAAIAQWICLHLPFCRPRFESQAHQLRFYQFIFELCHVEKPKINKNEGGLAHF